MYPLNLHITLLFCIYLMELFNFIKIKKTPKLLFFCIYLLPCFLHEMPSLPLFSLSFQSTVNYSCRLFCFFYVTIKLLFVPFKNVCHNWILFCTKNNEYTGEFWQNTAKVGKRGLQKKKKKWRKLQVLIDLYQHFKLSLSGVKEINTTRLKRLISQNIIYTSKTAQLTLIKFRTYFLLL